METLKDPSSVISNKGIKKLNKTKIMIRVLSFILISTFCFLVCDDVRKQKIYESINISFASNKEVEYGADYNPMDLVKKVSQGSIKSYTEKVDTSTIGTKEVVFEVEKDDVIKQVSVEVVVKDTKAPTIELTNAEVNVYTGDAYDVRSNVAKVNDVIDGDISYSETELENNSYYLISSDLDTNTAGNYTATVKAVDNNGNINEASYQINVIAKPKVVTVKKYTPKSVYNGPASVDTSSVIGAAQSLIGAKYVHGGSNPATGFDCSGFVQYIYSAVGKSISRTSKSQERDGMAVDRQNLQPGDIIIWTRKGSNTPSHSSIYVGDNTIIHAINSRKGVQQTNLSSWESYGYNIDAIRRI